MKLIKVPRVNALGYEGPTGAPDLIVAELEKNKLKLDVSSVDVDNSNVEASEKAIYGGASGIFANLEGERAVFVGGDHSISYPIVKAFGEKFNDAFLIVFDAHADCDYCAKEPTHEEWLRGVVEAGFKPENIVLVGARKMWDVEKKFLREKGIKVFSEVYDIEAIGDYVTENAMGKDVYVSIDVDVLDPAVAPGVSYAEPNGLSSRELFYLLRRIFCIKSLRAIDVVEVDVVKDEKYDFRTVKVSAKIIDEFLGSERK
ncbi:arginase family protein [archaeon]|jgi:arginase family enzyme|nr:arginase family protein [archaeon]MBT3577912.1 arginase family protein [archaeon]MBT6819724.1 arginase family protein [archaeon]MBT6956008.1 arginase family protein [archaeon]MBT7025507.1 arginase family protein [archaeon]